MHLATIVLRRELPAILEKTKWPFILNYVDLSRLRVEGNEADVAFAQRAISNRHLCADFFALSLALAREHPQGEHPGQEKRVLLDIGHHLEHQISRVRNKARF